MDTSASTEPTSHPDTEPRVLRPTRTSGLWLAATGFAVTLLLLAIFLLQNDQRVSVSYFGFDGQVPLSVAMLLSAVAGALLVATAGMARVLQLRHTARRERKARTSG
ncbi:MAG: hypothetical protein JWO12_1951 [Frankiales bacterium]|nr:hypothetical protein [Frankiales bacterium]